MSKCIPRSRHDSAKSKSPPHSPPHSAMSSFPAPNSSSFAAIGFAAISV
jgi:hypothetical protein